MTVGAVGKVICLCHCVTSETQTAVASLVCSRLIQQLSSMQGSTIQQKIILQLTLTLHTCTESQTVPLTIAGVKVEDGPLKAE